MRESISPTLFQKQADSHLNLSLHGDAEKGDEVHDQDGPEDRHVEKLKEGADEGDDGCLGGGVPELELGQPSDEGPELFVLSGGQLGSICKDEALGHFFGTVMIYCGSGSYFGKG